MSYFGTYLKSTPQAFSLSGAVVGTPSSQVIVGVDPLLTVVEHRGQVGLEGGGFLNGANRVYLSLADAAHVNGNVLVNPSAGVVPVYFTVVEFRRQFLRQSVYYSTLDLSSIQNSNTLATGLTLGSKAFLVPAGFASDYNTAGSLNEGAHCVAMDLNIATGVVTVLRSTSGCAIRAAFFVVDPK